MSAKTPRITGPALVNVWSESEQVRKLVARSAPAGDAMPLNVQAVTGDVGLVMGALEEADQDHVPVALVRAGKGWAAVVRIEDFPALRTYLAVAPRVPLMDAKIEGSA